MTNTTKQKLLEKGLEIIIKQGYHHTGIQEVLQAVGVPKGSFYHFFESKEDFGIQVLDHYSGQAMAQARDVLTNPELPPVARLRLFFSDGCDFSAQNEYSGGCLIGNLTQELGSLSPAFAHQLEGKWRAMRDLLSNCIREAQERGDLKVKQSPGQLADFLINSWQGSIMRAKVAKTALPQEQFLKTVFQHLLI